MKTPKTIYGSVIITVFLLTIIIKGTSVHAEIPVITLSNITYTVSTSTCPVITKQLSLKGVNNKDEVKKLQKFLRDNQKANTVESGIFDLATENAVKAFQVKYAKDILSPWSAIEPSGLVGITTIRKINAIACGESLNLNAKEAGFIEESIVKRDAERNRTMSSDDAMKSSSGPKINNENNMDNTASAANTSASLKSSMVKRLWSFIKNLL